MWLQCDKVQYPQCSYRDERNFFATHIILCDIVYQNGKKISQKLIFIQALSLKHAHLPFPFHSHYFCFTFVFNIISNNPTFRELLSCDIYERKSMKNLQTKHILDTGTFISTQPSLVAPKPVNFTWLFV